MVICKRCYTSMVGVMSFSKNKHEKFCRCPKCYSETKHSQIKDDELDFKEILETKMIGDMRSDSKKNKFITRSVGNS